MTNSDNAFLSGSLITRTRYHYQVLATALDSLLKVQFEQSKEEDISVWIKRSCEISDQFNYWYKEMNVHMLGSDSYFFFRSCL